MRTADRPQAEVLQGRVRPGRTTVALLGSVEGRGSPHWPIHYWQIPLEQAVSRPARFATKTAKAAPRRRVSLHLLPSGGVLVDNPEFENFNCRHPQGLMDVFKTSSDLPLTVASAIAATTGMRLRSHGCHRVSTKMASDQRRFAKFPENFNTKRAQASDSRSWQVPMADVEITGIAPFFIVSHVPTSLAFYRDRLRFEITFPGA